MFKVFRKKTTEEKMIELKCKIASMEKQLGVMWKIENSGNYSFGKRNEIIDLEKRLAYRKKMLELTSI